MSAEDNVKRKSQATLDFIMTYGWAFLVVLIVIVVLGHFYFNCENAPRYSVWFTDCPIASPPKEDFVVDSEPELQVICNKLVVNNIVYPFLEVMGNELRKANNAQFVTYKFPAELRSNLDIFNVDDLILCGVPTELCYTKNNDIKGGTYCFLMILEVPVLYLDYVRWYQEVVGVSVGG